MNHFFADLPLDYDCGIDEEYKPVPTNLLKVLGYISCFWLCVLAIAAWHYWGKP